MDRQLLFDALRQIADYVNDLIPDHWAKALVAGIVVIGGAIWTAYKAWWALRNRTFYRRFHFSLNILHNGVLSIRTIDEQDASEVLLDNRSAVSMLVKAAKRTTKAEPFLAIADDTQRWLVLNAALNELANKTGASGWLNLENGQPTLIVPYVIGLTCERDDEVRMRKVRLMIIRKDLLAAISRGDVPEPTFEAPHHNVRWKTLQAMGAIYAREGVGKQLLEYNVALPRLGASVDPPGATKGALPAPKPGTPDKAPDAQPAGKT